MRRANAPKYERAREAIGERDGLLADKGAADDQANHPYLDYAFRKLLAALWLVLALAVATAIKLPDVLRHGHLPKSMPTYVARVGPENAYNLFAFRIGLAGFVAWLAIACYLIIWLKYMLQMPGEWEELAPRAIPVATGCAVGSILGFVAALWPIWSVMTLPIVFFLFLGVLNLAHFVPL